MCLDFKVLRSFRIKLHGILQLMDVKRLLSVNEKYKTVPRGSND